MSSFRLSFAKRNAYAKDKTSKNCSSTAEKTANERVIFDTKEYQICFGNGEPQGVCPDSIFELPSESVTKLKFVEPMYARSVERLPEGRDWPVKSN